MWLKPAAFRVFRTIEKRNARLHVEKRRPIQHIHTPHLQPTTINFNEAHNGHSDWIGSARRACSKNTSLAIIQIRFDFEPLHLHFVKRIQEDEMAELLAETAELYRNPDEAEIAKDLREKAVILYEYLQTSSGAYSLERVIRITQLKGLI